MLMFCSTKGIFVAFFFRGHWHSTCAQRREGGSIMNIYLRTKRKGDPGDIYVRNVELICS